MTPDYSDIIEKKALRELLRTYERGKLRTFVLNLRRWLSSHEDDDPMRQDLPNVGMLLDDGHVLGTSEADHVRCLNLWLAHALQSGDTVVRGHQVPDAVTAAIRASDAWDEETKSELIGYVSQPEIARLFGLFLQDLSRLSGSD